MVVICESYKMWKHCWFPTSAYFSVEYQYISPHQNSHKFQDVSLCPIGCAPVLFYKQCTIYLLAKNSLQLLRNISFIFLRMKWNMRAGSFHRISHFKYFIFENIFNDIVSKPQFALNRCSGTHSFCWQEAVHPLK